MEEHRHNAKFGIRKQLFLLAALVAVALLIIAASSSFGKPFLSPEVKFTDASKGGLQIVPASCPSTPDYPGQCDTPPQPYPGCGLSASSYDISSGQSVTLYWNYPYQFPPGYNITVGLWDPNTNGWIATSLPDSGSMTVTPNATTDYVLGADYPAVSSYVTAPDCDATITVTAPPSCPDGSAAPNGDPNQCTCAQGNANACNNGSCPAGSSIQNGQCVEACQSGPAGSYCTCPGGFSAQNGECVLSTCPTGYTSQNGQCTFTGCPQDYTQQGNTCVLNQCASGYICGSDGNQYYESSSCTVSSSPTQTCNYGCFSGACLPPPSPELATWRVVPVLLKSGETTSVSWWAENVTSCSITGSNGNSWSGLSGNETSSPILGQTIYTITCNALSGATPSSVSTSTTVNIVPTYQEI